MPRWRVACDGCDRSAWIGAVDAVPGAAPAAFDAWCEACQEGVRLEGATSGSCAVCGRPLTIAAPRFVEVFGALQNLAAVLAAWDGDAAALAELLPERPRFLTDLDPAVPVPGDPDEVRSALAALDQGAWTEAEARLKTLAAERDDARLWRALAVAHERRGGLAAAEAALDHALARDESAGLRLQRGALRARRRSRRAAREDLARAGSGFEARWNRAALALLEAVATHPRLPEAPVLERARAETGEPSSAWSDHTVGRLLWSLLVERATLHLRESRPECPDARVLRAAEQLLEFDTFWDRAMVLEGYARLGLAAEAARVAHPLALGLAQGIAGEPALAGAMAGGISTVLRGALHAMEAGRPGQACDAIVSLLRRDDLPRYRVPCVCGRGAVGVVEVIDAGEEAGVEAG